MELQNLKDQISKAGFSEEVLNSLNSIIDGAIARGNLLEEEQKRLSEIVDKEIGQADTQANVMEEIALSLDSYAYDLDQTLNVADQKTKALEESFNSQMDDLEQKTKQVSGVTP